MEPSYRSYAVQTSHYFDRPHSGIPAGPVGGAAAWRGDALGDEAWCQTLGSEPIAEIDAALDAAEATGRPLAEWKSEDVPLPELSARIDEWRPVPTGNWEFCLTMLR